MEAARVFRSIFPVALIRPPHLTIIPSLFRNILQFSPLQSVTNPSIQHSMEIDFMGMFSDDPAPQPLPVDTSISLGMGSDGDGDGNVSLSLCPSSHIDETAVFQDFLWKKMQKTPAENSSSIQSSAYNYDWESVPPTERSFPSVVGKPNIAHSGFPYNFNDGSTISSNAFEGHLSFPASSTVFCPNDASSFFPAQKADKKIYATGDASFNDTPKSRDGYTPTVAMARKATLARFLEKRSHRLNQQINRRLMGSLDLYEIMQQED